MHDRSHISDVIGIINLIGGNQPKG